MRASKLITISTVAVLMGGTSMAVGHSLQSSESQGGTSTQGPASISQSNARGPETRGSNAQAAQNGMRRGEVPGGRSSKLLGSRESQRSQAMIKQRGRGLTGERGQGPSPERGGAITGARGQALIERGQQTTGQGAQRAAQMQGQRGSQARQSFAPTGGPVYARATAAEAHVGLTPDQRARLRETARRELPRVSHIPEARVNAVVPRNVQLAPVPEEIARYYPRFRRDQAFLYRNQIVLVDPTTSRIVAVLPA